MPLPKIPNLVLACALLARAAGLANTFDVLQANHTLHLAYAAFCNASSLRAWDCQWCVRTAPANLLSYLVDTRAGTQGYVAVQPSLSRVVVAYRGTWNVKNALQDGEFVLVKPPFGPRGVRVHSGFLRAYASLRDASRRAVAAAHAICGENCSTLFTGHSLGAAMASLAAAEAAGAGLRVAQLYSFGSPRVGNRAWAEWAHAVVAGSGGPGSMRMRRRWDMAPALPPRSIGYHHLPTEIWDEHACTESDSFVVCDGSGEDPECGDSEEWPVFPLDLFRLSTAQHTMYMGFKGGYCDGSD